LRGGVGNHPRLEKNDGKDGNEGRPDEAAGRHEAEGDEQAAGRQQPGRQGRRQERERVRVRRRPVPVTAAWLVGVLVLVAMLFWDQLAELARLATRHRPGPW